MVLTGCGWFWLVACFINNAFLIHFGKRLEDQQWLGVRLVRCDR